MKRRLAAIVLLLSLMIPGCGHAHKTLVVASLPALHSLLSELTSHTSISVARAFPPDVSIPEMQQYIDDHPDRIDSLSRCDGVVDLRSIMPQDALFAALRQRNIRIVEIDCATPPDPRVTGLPLIADEPRNAIPYVWLSITHCMKMGEIAAKDLARLSPMDSAAIMRNLDTLKMTFFALKSRYESGFASLGEFRTAVLTHDFDYFLSDINIFISCEFPQDAAEWRDSTRARLSAAVRSGDFTTIVNRWKMPGDVGRFIDSCGISTIVMSVGDPAMKSYDNGIYGLIQSNLESLHSALVHRTESR